MAYQERLRDLQTSKYWLDPAHAKFRQYFEGKYLVDNFVKVGAQI